MNWVKKGIVAELKTLKDFKIWCIRNKVAMSEKLEEMIKEVMKK